MELMISIIMLGTILVICIAVIVCCIIGCILYIKIRINQDKMNDQFRRITENLEYSKEVLDYIKTFAAQIIVLRFQEFLDGYHMEKITRELFKNIISKITIEIHDSIKMDNFDFSRLMFDKEFIEKYLIQSCMTMSKKMLSEALIDFEE